jgi:hypothetical protein
MTRVSRISVGSIGGGYRLDRSTILADLALDRLTGQTEQDWFLAGPDDTVDLGPSEVRTPI